MEFNSFLREKAPRLFNFIAKLMKSYSVKEVDFGPYFTPLINHWIDQTRIKLKEWTTRMISNEKVHKFQDILII
jgi:hypothetical protein